MKDVLLKGGAEVGRRLTLNSEVIYTTGEAATLRVTTQNAGPTRIHIDCVENLATHSCSTAVVVSKRPQYRRQVVSRLNKDRAECSQPRCVKDNY